MLRQLNFILEGKTITVYQRKKSLRDNGRVESLNIMKPNRDLIILVRLFFFYSKFSDIYQQKII